ncbi:cytochrome c oxidase subunit 3 [Nocardia sp. NPDC003963]
MTDTDLPARTTDRPTRPPGARLPGDNAMWVMVLGDLVIFGSYFVIFMVHRALEPAEFLAAQQHLELTVGTVNTVLLLTSSWFVACGVQAARRGQARSARRLIYAAAALGVAFVAAKSYEWSAEITGGHTLAHNQFFGFYYMLTGVHLFHVGLGLLILGLVVRELRPSGRHRIAMVESGALYWHLVDLLWIVIFALLYVLR